MFRNVLILAFLIIAAVAFGRWLKRPRKIFVARVREDRVDVRGPVPHRSQEDFAAFVKTLRLPLGARVIAFEDHGGFRLEFSASIRREDREQVERYLRGPRLEAVP